MSKTDICKRGNRHFPILHGYAVQMISSLNQSPSWIARWRGSRLVIMPLVILGVGLWIASVQGRSATVDSERVRIFLIQVLEETARDPQSTTHSLDASDSIIAEEFRSRMRGAASQLTMPAPLVEVRVGDFGVGTAGTATHTALACYRGGRGIAVRVIATPGESQIRIIGVFTPDGSDFGSMDPGAFTTADGPVEMP